MASFEEKGGFCKACEKKVIIKRKGTSHVLHLLLTLVTGGLWLLVWIGSAIKFGGWYCSQCGSKAIK